MAKNKMSSLVVLVMFVLVGAVVYSVYLQSQATQQSVVATQPPNVQVVATQTAEALVAGDPATVNVNVKDKSSYSASQVAVAFLYEEMDKDGKYLSQKNTTSSASADTAVSTARGNKYKSVAASSTFYGDLVEGTVSAGTLALELPAYQIASNLEMICYYRSASQSANNIEGCNITMGANDLDNFDYLDIRQNNSQRVFNLKMIGVNVSSASSNIDDVDMAGGIQTIKGSSVLSKLSESNGAMLSETNYVPKRLKSRLDYTFVFDKPIMMFEGDRVRTSAIKFDAGASNPSEDGTFYIIDENYFLGSTSPNQGKILSGVETDENNPSNVGASDLEREWHIN